MLKSSQDRRTVNTEGQSTQKSRQAQGQLIKKKQDFEDSRTVQKKLSLDSRAVRAEGQLGQKGSKDRGAVKTKEGII